MKRIGIDAIALAVPEGYVELADLAHARSVSPGKFVDGLGVERMAVARAHEDPVALGANAARRLFAMSGADTSRIGLCVVGTETAVDHSKPIAAYLHGLLALPTACRVFEAKHACFGGTAGLLNAVDWIASGSARGRQALVVCTDVARYAIGSAGEPTQGAGAVALLVSENPRLVELEVGVTGSYARDVHDFWRPLHSKEAVVDGHYSVQCYLDALTGAYEAWRHACGTDYSEPIARRCYHVPYGKMAKKAHRHVMALEGKGEAEADASYVEEVGTSLRLPAQIGNVYTGSLYLALASLLEAEASRIEGKRVALFSYGSGCTAEFFAGRVASGAGAFSRALRLAEPLEGRRRYTIPEYEAIRRADADADRRPIESANFGAGTVAFLGVEGERRVYTGYTE
ncbi:hydroxymethylglutaryl-CoA synthase [Pendulispora rubella]|uniref:Hydroxymethylglutaryl-CoA synthase n=1 Tax=Pendulispora rubella TaxID=2741070 RepID=A0ABZ2KQQ3_9BACT